MAQLAQSVTVAPPAAKAPLHSLIRVADDLLSLDGDATDITRNVADRWEAGVEYLPECGDPGGVIVPCTEVELEALGFADPVEVIPFTVITGVTCSTFGAGAIDFESRLRRRVEAIASFQLEQEFWQGTAVTAADCPNHFLSQSAEVTDINPGAVSTPLLQAFALMQFRLGRCLFGAPGMIHMPRHVMALLHSAGMIEKEVFGDLTRYWDVFGNEIVAGAGYDGSSPDGITPDGGSIYWMYGTSRVAVATSEMVITPNTRAEAVNRATNDITYFGMMTVVAAWDNCCHLGIAVNICETCCTGDLMPDDDA